MNFLIEVCIQYGRGKLANVNDQRGAFTFLSFLRLWAKHSSTQREGTFANCSRFTKLHVGRPISTLCIRDIPFPGTSGRADRKRTNISPKLLFAVCPSHFQLETPKWTFLRPVSKDLPSARPSFAMLAPAYALHHDPPWSHGTHHVNSHPGRFPLANNFELRGVTRVYVPCARNIYSCMCVCVHMYARRPFGL